MTFQPQRNRPQEQEAPWSVHEACRRRTSYPWSCLPRPVPARAAPARGLRHGSDGRSRHASLSGVGSSAAAERRRGPVVLGGSACVAYGQRFDQCRKCFVDLGRVGIPSHSGTAVLTRAIGRIVFDTHVVLPGRTAFVRAVTHFGGTYPITCTPAARAMSATSITSPYRQVPSTRRNSSFCGRLA